MTHDEPRLRPARGSRGDCATAVQPPSYYALRVDARVDAPRWWAAARRAIALAPPAVRAILAGRSRVEVTAEEARAALAWARALVPGDADAPSPLRVHPGDAPDQS
jgi:hypothetical protein